MAVEISKNNSGIDAALVVLRHELECMQKQDKDLYKQLLTLQDNIRGLKVEIKRERDECEEAFRDLQTLDNELKENEATKEQQTAEKFIHKQPVEKESKNTRGKHERQDSGISVKHFSSEELTTNTNGIPVKPTIIHHSKQDSGILIDEETMGETKILSRLVQSSSRMFSRVENGKLRYSSNNRYQQVDNASNNNNHNQTKSSNDLDRGKYFSAFRDSNSHSRTKSCPSTSMKKLNQDCCNYKVIGSHHVRPKKRSASVVDLRRFPEGGRSDVLVDQSNENRRIIKAGVACSESELFHAEDEPLRAVFVCAGEVSVSSSTYERRGNPMERNGRAAFEHKSVPQRRFIGLKPLTKKQSYDYVGQTSNDEVAMTLSPSFQFPRNHTRHRPMPENNTRRSHSIMHASSKSWDGSMERSRRVTTNLLRSTSQISLV